jgi:type IV secretion system protein TrbE
MRLTEHRRTAQGLADLLLYAAMIEDGVLLLQDGALLAGWQFRGPDMASATHGEMAALSARLNSILRLGSGWMIHCDAIRYHAPGYPKEAHFPDPVTRMIDDERRQQFLDEGAHFESDYFLALTYLPPAEAEQRFKGWMFEGKRPIKSTAKTALDHFLSRTSAFEDVLRSLFQVHRLRARMVGAADGHPRAHDDLLRYVRRSISGDDYSFDLPEIPVDLNQHLACDDFVGGIEPQIGRKHIRILAVDGFPRMSFPGILGALDTLPIEYRWNTRAILLDPEEARALLDKTRKKWRAKMRGWKDQLFRTGTGPVNLYAQEMAEDAEEAMGDAASGDVHFAQYTNVIICYNADRNRLDDTVSLVIKTIRNLGFGCREETVNAIEAWRGSLPGDGYRNVRRVLLHTLNISYLLPITSVWAGEKHNPSPLMPRGSAPLLYAATTGATPFRFNLHVGDVGHGLMVGPPGAGKSTFLATIAAQWFRYPKAQVFAFDKGYSLFVLTAAAGGEFYDIAGETTDWAFCPLRELDTPGDVAWAVDWLESLCELQAFQVTPKNRSALLHGVQSLAASPTRTLTELLACVQDAEIREALEYYTLAGAMGPLLDADHDMLGSGRLLTFECEHLMNLGEKAIVAVLLYLFRRIEKRLDGSPTLVPLDEAWVYLKHSLFRERIREWLKTLRKFNGCVLLATQNLSDIFNSPIRDVVLESCPTKILLPNAEAANPASHQFYDLIGLNEREIDIIQKSLPKCQYYVVSSAGRRLISLGLGQVALSFVAVSSREERQASIDVMDHFGTSWVQEWLRLRGLSDWACYFDDLLSERSTA